MHYRNYLICFSIEAKPADKLAPVISRPDIAVTPGAKYQISFDVKAPAGATFRLRIVAGKKTLKNIVSTTRGAQWTQSTGNFTVPQGVEKIIMYLFISDAPQGGFIDNVVLKRQ